VSDRRQDAQRETFEIGKSTVRASLVAAALTPPIGDEARTSRQNGRSSRKPCAHGRRRNEAVEMPNLFSSRREWSRSSLGDIAIGNLRRHARDIPAIKIGEFAPRAIEAVVSGTACHAERWPQFSSVRRIFRTVDTTKCGAASSQRIAEGSRAGRYILDELAS